MLVRALVIAAVVFALALPNAAFAGEQVPFRGTWEGSTVSAELVGPNVVFVVSAGSGNATQLGRFEMVTPHLSYLDTFVVEGTQVFTAANGDTLAATIDGQLALNSEGNLEGTLAGVITGGTGRFEGATGSYDFHLVARPAAFGFDSTATIDGTISTVGANKR
jgi:hypothetical protein